jgi:hypothetical protein
MLIAVESSDKYRTASWVNNRFAIIWQLALPLTPIASNITVQHIPKTAFQFHVSKHANSGKQFFDIISLCDWQASAVVLVSQR